MFQQFSPEVAATRPWRWTTRDRSSTSGFLAATAKVALLPVCRRLRSRAVRLLLPVRSARSARPARPCSGRVPASASPWRCTASARAVTWYRYRKWWYRYRKWWYRYRKSFDPGAAADRRRLPGRATSGRWRWWSRAVDGACTGCAIRDSIGNSCFWRPTPATSPSSSTSRINVDRRVRRNVHPPAPPVLCLLTTSSNWKVYSYSHHRQAVVTTTIPLRLDGRSTSNNIRTAVKLRRIGVERRRIDVES